MDGTGACPGTTLLGWGWCDCSRGLGCAAQRIWGWEGGFFPIPFGQGIQMGILLSSMVLCLWAPLNQQGVLFIGGRTPVCL